MKKTDTRPLYGIYDCRLNKNTKNWNGLEWVIDGEYGRDTFPGTMTREEARRAYRNGPNRHDEQTANDNRR